MAAATGIAAPFFNPALLAWEAPQAEPETLADRPPWGVGLEAAVGLSVHGDLLEIAQRLADADLQSLSEDGITSQSDLRRVLGVARDLARIGEPGNVVLGEATSLTGVRIGRFQIGFGLHGQSSAVVSDTDLRNVAVGVGGLLLADAINGTGAAQDGRIDVLSSQQRDDIYGALGGAGAFDPGTEAGQAVLRLDYALRDLDLSPEQRHTVAQILAAAGHDLGAIDDNVTALRIGGFILTEVPVSAAWRISEQWRIGGSLKLMAGRVYGTEVSIFNKDAALHLTRGIEDYEQTLTWGIDLGAVFEVGWFSVGLSGRNLNSPEFDGVVDRYGVRIGDVELEAQATLGLAAHPWPWFQAALDLDLWEVGTTYPGYHTQRIGLGLELQPIGILALRGGVSLNLAEDDLGPLFSLGAGFSLGPVQLDLALAASGDVTSIGGYDLPDQMRVALGVGASF